jgi:23S rRNA pseudouridine2604 synthase
MACLLPANAMTDPIRLAKRVVALAGCSRQDAEQYIEGGWVRVDGEVVDEPQFMVGDQDVTLDPAAKLAPTEPTTLLLHKPAGVVSDTDSLLAQSRSDTDDTGIRFLKRHFGRLTVVMPLDPDVSGLIAFTQDGRLLRRVADEGSRIEQEFIVEVAGELAPWGLIRLAHGLIYDGRVLAPAKVSWQNEDRLRFAIKGVRPGQLAWMCAQVGLTIVSCKRLRIGRVSLAKMPPGQWRYLPTSERF